MYYENEGALTIGGVCLSNAVLGERDAVSNINLSKVVGKGYKSFWECKKRYRVLKGGRGSKKSTSAAIWFPYNMMKYYHKYGLKPHTLVIRRYFNTHKDSTYAQLLWAINRLGVRHLWKATKSPLQLEYIPSGQKIMFRGLDDPQSITSITVEDGHLCWTWWEEAYQCSNEDDFNKIDLSIRGEVPEPLFKQHTLTLNPWSEKIWIKKRFFDTPHPNVLAMTRNFDCNEFLGADDIAIFEDMKQNHPHRWKIEGLGDWGISEGLVFENWEEREFNWEYMRFQKDRYDQPVYKQFYGLDFGYSNDPTAFIALLVDVKNKEIYIYDEIYKTYMKNEDIYRQIEYKGYHRERIMADSSAPKDIDTLRDMGLTRIKGAKKPKGSVNSGIQKLRDYKIIVHPRCPNTMVELTNYIWEPDKDTGKPTNDPIDDYNHLMDALRYATESLQKATFSW